MKTLTFISAIVFGVASIGAQAHQRDTVVWARVVDVDPVYRWVDIRTPARSCWVETVATEVPSSNRVASTLAGGVIGGAIGHAAGHGHKNKHLGAAVGTVIGLAIGNDVGRKNERHARVEYREVEHCKVTHTSRRERELLGYDVVYRLNGRLQRTRTSHHPGNRIQVSTHIHGSSHGHHGHH